jgi:hypothetical protein
MSDLRLGLDSRLELYIGLWVGLGFELMLSLER